MCICVHFARPDNIVYGVYLYVSGEAREIMRMRGRHLAWQQTRVSSLDPLLCTSQRRIRQRTPQPTVNVTLSALMMH